MGKIVLPSEIVKNLVFGEDLQDYKVIEQDEWEEDMKYQFKSMVFEYDNKFYSLLVSRSGSCNTEWYYEWEDTDEFECREVEKKEKNTHEWIEKE